MSYGPLLRYASDKQEHSLREALETLAIEVVVRLARVVAYLPETDITEVSPWSQTIRRPYHTETAAATLCLGKGIRRGYLSPASVPPLPRDHQIIGPGIARENHDAITMFFSEMFR